MEIIKKQVTLLTVTGSTVDGVVIIPDTSVIYSFKLLLKSEGTDFGFFDALPLNPTQLDDNGNPIDLDNLL